MDPARIEETVLERDDVRDHLEGNGNVIETETEGTGVESGTIAANEMTRETDAGDATILPIHGAMVIVALNETLAVRARYGLNTL